MGRTPVRMHRRSFLWGSLAVAGAGLLGGCGSPSLPARRSSAVPRVGWLGGSSEGSRATLAAFRQGLRDLGYAEGDNIALELRFTEGGEERLPELAAELVGLPAEVIVTTGSPAGLAAKRTTANIPIVAISGEPVETGLVASLARPGGNITGLSLLPAGGLEGKRLELLKEIMPGLARVAILGNTDNAAHTLNLEDSRVAGRQLGIGVQALRVRSGEDLESVLGAALKLGAEGLFVRNDPLTAALRPPILAFVAEHRLPLVGERPFVEGGGLLSYGVNVPAVFRRAAAYVDKILKGTSPADLPVEQPTTFDFILNLKTAQALGLTIPQSVLQQATEAIQ